MFSSRCLRFFLGIVVFTVTMVAFQNCSKTSFVAEASSSSQKVEDASTDGPGAEQEPGDDGNQVADAEDLVECQLGSPNAKIILNLNFVTGSNDSATRICMSKNACLSLFNTYAAERGCSLSSGPATAAAPAGTQCTEIFPGSKGTCHNAKALTDAQVTSMLQEMSK